MARFIVDSCNVCMVPRVLQEFMLSLRRARDESIDPLEKLKEKHPSTKTMRGLKRDVHDLDTADMYPKVVRNEDGKTRDALSNVRVAGAKQSVVEALLNELELNPSIFIQDKPNNMRVGAEVHMS